MGSRPSVPPTVTRSGFATTSGNDSFAAAINNVFISSIGVSSAVNALSLSVSPAPFTHSVPCARRKSTAPFGSSSFSGSGSFFASLSSVSDEPVFVVASFSASFSAACSKNVSASTVTSPSMPSSATAPLLDHVKCKHRSPSSPNASSSGSIDPSSFSASLSDTSSSADREARSFLELSFVCVISPLVMTPSNQSGSKPIGPSFFNVPEARRELLEMMKMRAPDSCNRRTVSIAHGYATLPS
mmetsp:Transcript_7215/g.30733  ORF Transcript_7215/g.30733 Transcript_7215/m.30733 type:complete len:242 (+) Transcript_7215:1039-1764(+)